MTRRLLLTLLIALGLAAGLLSFKARYGAEARNRRVELVIDYSDAQQLANTKGRAIGTVLNDLHHAGITTVAITEDTLGTLYGGGVVTYKRDADTTVLTFAKGFTSQRPRVLEALRHKTGLTVTAEGATTIRVNAPWPQFNGTPIGLDQTAVETVQQSGLLIAPRLYNFTGVNPENVAWELAAVKQQCATAQGIGPLIFAGSAVLGNRGELGLVADAIQSEHLTYGSVEFAKTLGDEDLARKAAYSTVRVHSIGVDEMGTMDEPTAIERFVRAARERNIRVCYVRLFLTGLAAEPDAVQANLDFVKKIVDGMTLAHLSVGGPEPAAHPFETDPTPAPHLRIAMAVGVMAGFVWLLWLFAGLDGPAFGVVLGAALLIGAGLALPQTSAKGREILALISACTFPALGLCAFALPRPHPDQTTGKILGRAFAAYARMTLSTLAGVVLIVGLLSGRLFLLKVDAFLGVKAVLVAPILLVAAYYGLGLAALGHRASWAERKATVWNTVRSLGAQPLQIGQVVVGLAALVALALFVARSGNDPGVGVSASELKMRALLDKYLGVRPRTKEFLLGHPALFAGLAAAAGGRFGRAILPLLVIGSIGQSSLLDTFCHLHTPLDISLLRALYGWLLGAVIGAAAYAVAARAAKADSCPA